MESNGRRIYYYKNLDTNGGFKNNFMEACPSYRYSAIKRRKILRNQNTLKYNLSTKLLNNGFRKIELRMFPRKIST